jgi:hypothetical protein
MLIHVKIIRWLVSTFEYVSYLRLASDEWPLTGVKSLGISWRESYESCSRSIQLLLLSSVSPVLTCTIVTFVYSLQAHDATKQCRL